MRVELAIALLAKDDVLLLDKPTNHLDIRGVLWLGQYLVNQKDSCFKKSNSSSPPTLVVIPHDRAFVKAAATDIIIMDN